MTDRPANPITTRLAPANPAQLTRLAFVVGVVLGLPLLAIPLWVFAQRLTPPHYLLRPDALWIATLGPLLAVWGAGVAVMVEARRLWHQMMDSGDLRLLTMSGLDSARIVNGVAAAAFSRMRAVWGAAVGTLPALLATITLAVLETKDGLPTCTPSFPPCTFPQGVGVVMWESAPTVLLAALLIAAVAGVWWWAAPRAVRGAVISAGGALAALVLTVDGFVELSTDIFPRVSPMRIEAGVMVAALMITLGLAWRGHASLIEQAGGPHSTLHSLILAGGGLFGLLWVMLHSVPAGLRFANVTTIAALALVVLGPLLRGSSALRISAGSTAFAWVLALHPILSAALLDLWTPMRGCVLPVSFGVSMCGPEALLAVNRAALIVWLVLLGLGGGLWWITWRTERVLLWAIGVVAIGGALWALRPVFERPPSWPLALPLVVITGLWAVGWLYPLRVRGRR